jgi:hypothetical protein
VTEISEEAVAAATIAIGRDLLSGNVYETAEDSNEALARAALEAAAPIMAEAVAQKILAHMEAHGPQAGTPLGGTLRRAWRRHFGIAARVAAFAFSTEEDEKRAAAEAVARGDMIVCPGPEPGEEDDGR